jgi:hypothetical protein
MHCGWDCCQKGFLAGRSNDLADYRTCFCFFLPYFTMGAGVAGIFHSRSVYYTDGFSISKE